jgi:hypothetical protein
MTKRQFVLVVVDRDTGYRGRSDERRPALEQRGGRCSKGRPQHPMLQHRRYYAGSRCNRMALVLRGLQDCVWLDRVGALPRDALTKAPVRRPPGAHASIGTEPSTRPQMAAVRPRGDL